MKISLFLSLLLFSHTSFSSTWVGKQKALVLLLEWPNVNQTKTKEEVEQTFFGENNLSLRQYFKENSNGKFDFSGKVMDWRQAKVRFNESRGCSLDYIVDQAKSVFMQDVDISKYDEDGNGKVDNLFVVHSGRIPHDRVGPSCTFTRDRSADHMVVFQIGGIGTKGKDIGIGFYLHEGGHEYFNLPDLYGNHYRGKYGIGMWGMMGLGAWGVSNDISEDDLFRYPAHFEPKSNTNILRAFT